MASNTDQSAIELLNGEAILHSQLFSFIRPMCLKFAVELGIADIIHNHAKPITFPELMLALVQVPPSKASLVKRFMHFLAHNGIFAIHKSQDEEQQHETYSLTPASKLLVKGSDHCLTPFILWATDPVRVNNYNHLGKWVCGEVPTLYESALGISLWEYLETNPEYMSTFNEGMASDCKLLKLALKDCSDVFEGLDTIVDVGGGNGTASKIISELYPKIKFVVFDLPQVVGNLVGSNNVSYVAGDMFVSIPQGDAVVLKRILHDWTDEDCIKILKKCKNSISSSEKGKVIIIDAIINEKEEDKVMTETKLSMDIMMMTNNGEERNEKEWKELFVAAGFKDYKIFNKHGLRSLIEVYP